MASNDDYILYGVDFFVDVEHLRDLSAAAQIDRIKQAIVTATHAGRYGCRVRLENSVAVRAIAAHLEKQGLCVAFAPVGSESLDVPSDPVMLSINWMP